MPLVFIGPTRRFAILFVTTSIIALAVSGCASDKECWEPDFSKRPASDYKAKKKR